MRALAIQGVTSLSIRPLHTAIYLGFIFSFLSLLYIPYVIHAFYVGKEITGWASLIMTVVFFGGLQLIIMGIIGIYIGMMFIRCYCYVAIPLGAVGHLLSIYVFTRSSMRSNPCSRYLLAATTFGMMLTIYTVPMRLIQSGFINTDPGAYSVVFSKTTWFKLYSIRYI